MKINFKKIVSVLASTVMVASTVALASAANYPAPFIQNGNSNVAIVVGSGAASTDYAAVFDINSNLATALENQTIPAVTQTGNSGVSVSGTIPDNVALASSTQPLFYNSALNSAKTTLSNTDLPTLLAGGTVTDNSGNQYTTTQTITLGGSTIQYGTADGDLSNPAIYIYSGTNSNQPLYTYQLTLNKPLNVSDTNVIGNTITILGQPYTIGANSQVQGQSNDVLYLYGQGTQTNLNEGSQSTVVIDGVSHTINVAGITQTGSNNQVYVSVDGSSSQVINQGASTQINGLQIYAKTIFYKGYQSSTAPSYATLDLGTNVLELQNHQNVEVGTSQTPIEGTEVSLQGSSSGMSSLSVSMTMNNSEADYILPGGSFVDPVFGGLKLNFVDTNPNFNGLISGNSTATSSGYDQFIVNTDGNRNVYVSYNPNTDVTGGTHLANPAMQDIVHDYETNQVNPLANMNLSNNGNNAISDIEGAGLNLNDYTIINSGDYGRLVRVTELPFSNGQQGSLTGFNPTIQIQDVATGDNLLGNSGLVLSTINGNTASGSTSFDGQTYNFAFSNVTDQLNITWGSGSSPGVIGTSQVIYPRIELANGDWFSILTPEMVQNGNTYSLPGLDSYASYSGGQAISWNPSVNGTDNASAKAIFGNAVYAISTNNITNTGVIDGIYVNGNLVSFNSTSGDAAVLIQEQKKSDEVGNSNAGDIIVVPMGSWGSGTNVYPGIATPQITNISSGLQSWNGNSNQETEIDRYGTFLTYNTNDQHSVQIEYPHQQMVADVFFTAQGSTVSSSTSPTNTAAGNVKVLGSVVVDDNQVSTVAGKDLIVVGGSCVNAVAAQLLGVSYPMCGSAWQTATGVGAGSFLIQTFSQSGGSIATLVAGYNAADTANAAQYLIANSNIDTDANAKYIGTSASSATLQTAGTMTNSTTNSTG